MNDLGSVHFLALIPVMWCFLSWLLSRLSGWSQLATRYRESAQHSRQSVWDESAWMRSGRIGMVHYHSALCFRVSDQGLRISVAFPFRIGHPPLFIPWDEFHHVAEDAMLYSHKIKVAIGKPTVSSMTLPGWVRYRMPLEMRPPSPTFRE